jgi:hypothetical protein
MSTGKTKLQVLVLLDNINSAHSERILRQKLSMAARFLVIT